MAHAHFWGLVPNQDDGITYQQCLDDSCAQVAGPVMASGTGWWTCGEGVTILPERPVFHDEEKGKAWLRRWIATQNRDGGYVDPEACELAGLTKAAARVRRELGL